MGREKKSLSGLNRFDAIFFINLESCKERRRSIEAQLSMAGAEPGRVRRFAAIEDLLNGHRGCAKSHLGVLKIALQEKLENILILEDDFVFTQNSDAIDTFFHHFQSQWDVFFLSAKVLKHEPTKHDDIRRILSAKMAHSYAVHQRYFSVLIALYEHIVQEMEGHFTSGHTDEALYALDQTWNVLMPKGRWYAPRILLGHQSDGYSHIDHVHLSRPIPHMQLD